LKSSICILTLAAAALIGSHSNSALAQGVVAPAAGQASPREVHVGPEAFARGVPVPDWVEPVSVPAAGRKSAVVMRLADTQFRAAEKPAFFAHRAIQANEASALKKIGEFAIGFVPDYQRLSLHSIVVLRGEEKLDRTQSANIRFLQPASELANSVYTSSVTAAVVIDDVRVGDTLEYSYTIEGENPVFGGRYFQTASWEGEDPIDLRRVVFTAPEARRIQWKAVGDSSATIPDPKISERDGIRTYRFEGRSLDAVTIEPLTPNSYLPAHLIQFSEFASWDDVGAWAGALFPRQAPQSPEFSALVEKLRSRPTPAARLADALTYTQREIRYFSLSFLEGSHRPAAPDLVLQRRFGDCKDKSYFLITLLDALGIEAHPVLVSTQRSGRYEQLLPGPALFDHVIVEAKIDDKDYFVDPTALEEKGQIDRIGQALEGTQVLVLGATKAEPTTIPLSPAELDTSERHDEAVLKSLDGEGQLVSTTTFAGQHATLMRVVLARIDPKTIEKSVAAQFEQTYPGAVLTGPIEVQDNTELNRIVVTARVRIPEFAHKAGTAWVIPYRPDNMIGIVNPQVSAHRSFPMKVQGYPYFARYSFGLELPEEVAGVRDPKTERVDGAFFEYSLTRVFRGNHAKVDIEFRAKTAEVPANRVAEYAADTRKLTELGGWTVVVSPDEIKKKGLLGIGEKSLRDTMIARERDSISKYTASIQSGKLGDSDLADAHCERSAAYSALGEFDKALDDANRAVALAPNDAHMLGCRAEVYFSSGDFARSAGDASHAVILGEGQSHYFFQRGLARYYLKQYGDAANDFAKSSSLDNDPSNRAYSDLWAVWTHHLAGKPLPEEIAKRSAAEAHGDWPRPALAMLVGSLSPEELLKIVDQKKGDELAMTQTEAFFYLGQRYRMLGDAAKARDAFEKVRSLGLVPYLEYSSAAFELKEMEPAR